MAVQAELLAHQGQEHSQGEHEGLANTALLGMLLFITSEVMFFGGLFAVYFSIRAKHGAEWLHPPTLPEGIHFAVNPIVIVATVLLIISSFTMQWGIWRIRKGDRSGMNRAIAVTLLLGVVFLALQAYDYSLLINEGIRLNSGIFGSLFYTMTGFHGAHVFGGVVGLAVILARGAAGQFSAKHHVAVEAVSIYWHFVDVVWIALFTTLYILR
ncbi:MAG TPA: cytochrome c oxidase subunit 3 [Candidatus Limnocylindrales bacterium]|nr:cytochrome c oxidase subunit 3 [Candidatus Limnocylindrales bacterium]